MLWHTLAHKPMITLYAFLLSMSPFGEMKIAIPYAILHDIDPLTIFIVATLGNLLVFPITMTFMDKVHKSLLKYSGYSKLFQKMNLWVLKRISKDIKNNSFWSLLIFVGIPLPITGAYIGAMATWIFKIDRKTAFMAISGGVVIASAFLTAVGTAGYYLVS